MPATSSPLVFGSSWLLEMVRMEQRNRTVGFYWAPFSIIQDFPNPTDLFGAQFVGFSQPGGPPAEWLTTSMMFELAGVPLAETPSQLLALIAKPRPYRSLDRTLSSSSLSRRAKELVAMRYHSDVRIADIAHELGVSHAHLTRQFKRDFGLTPIDYLHHVRVSEAMGKLSLGSRPIDIGYDVGFNDTTRFYKDFKKVTGTSPGKCRASRSGH
jgi:AraC-like DNA-binding protein